MNAVRSNTASRGVWPALVVCALLAAGCSVAVPRGSLAAGGVQADGGGVAFDAGGSVDGLPGVTGDVNSGAAMDAGAAGSATGRAGAAAGGGSAPGQPTAGKAGSSSKAGSGSGGTTAAGGPSATGAGPAAAGGHVPGVTDERISISIIAGFTGPLAGMVENAYDALETWQDDVNAAGGIHGRKVHLIPVDHKETASGGVAACKQALSNDSFVAMVPEGIEANVTAVSCLDAAGMPTLYFAGTRDPAWRVAFSDVVTSDQGGTILGSYVRNSLAAGAKKVGVLYVNQLAYQATADTFTKEGRRLGLDIAAVKAIEPNQASFTSELVQMRNAGVEILVISATAEAIGILRDAQALGYRPTFTGWGFTFDFVTTAARDLFKGVTGLRTGATVDTPAYERYAERMRARGRGRDRTLDTEGFLAYGHSLLLGKMLTAAGKAPTWNSFVAGSETIAGYDNGILPPITYGRGDHVGAEAAFASVCCNSDWTWQRQGRAKARF